jgi:hypothetical protein
MGDVRSLPPEQRDQAQQRPELGDWIDSGTGNLEWHETQTRRSYRVAIFAHTSNDADLVASLSRRNCKPQPMRNEVPIRCDKKQQSAISMARGGHAILRFSEE